MALPQFPYEVTDHVIEQLRNKERMLTAKFKIIKSYKLIKGQYLPTLYKVLYYENINATVLSMNKQLLSNNLLYTYNTLETAHICFLLKMNINNFHIALNYISYGGYTLSHEQQLVLQNSLIILQNENHFEQTFLWGKIFGLDSDYYIAYGYEKDALKGRVFYYSTNCLDWGLLPEPSKHMKQLALMSSTRLQGDAALKLDVNTEYPVEVATAIEEEDEEDIIEPEENKKSKISQLLKEEDRLAATVALINDEAAIVPRGALFKRPDGYVVQNLAFKGLTLNEAQKLTSYQHYRKPQQRWNTNLLTQQDYNYAIDFLDTIDIDIPEEQTWNIHTKLGGKVVILRNVYWPGMTIYHLVRSEYYGFFYAGIGKKNMDVPFMT